MQNRERVLCLRAAAKRLRMPERTLRYRASRGRIAGAFKQGKLWKFSASALLFLSGVACTTTSAHFAAPSLRKPAAEFALKDADGKTVKLSDYKGKVVLLDFWATWCGPCKIEEPWLKEFERTYKDKGFAVLAVSMDEEGWDVVRPYIVRHELNYRVLMASADIDKIYPGMDAWPYTYLIDRQGKIAWSHMGVASKPTMRKTIEHLLGE
jgi:peroxiredoxin